MHNLIIGLGCLSDKVQPVLFSPGKIVDNKGNEYEVPLYAIKLDSKEEITKEVTAIIEQMFNKIEEDDAKLRVSV